MNRLNRTALFLRSLLSNDLNWTYKWFNYSKDFFVPGSEDFVVQGIWDHWPDVAPAFRQMQLILEADPPCTGHRILDVGCGLGGFVGLCRTRYPELGNITGVDINPVHIDAAYKKYGNLPGIKFIHGEAGERLVQDKNTFSPGLFDRIYLIELTQDINNIIFREIIRECCRLLSIDGSIVLFTLTLDRQPRTFYEQIASDMLIHKGAPERSDIENTLTTAGLIYSKRDVTHISTRMLIERLITDPSISSHMLLQPFSLIVQIAAQAGLDFINNGGYCVTIYVARKEIKG